MLHITSLMMSVEEGGLEIDGFCLDINCQLAGNIKRNHPKLALKIKKFMVGWLHSNAGHKLACQLNFCSMFREGTGRAIGEQPEQFWVSRV